VNTLTTYSKTLLFFSFFEEIKRYLRGVILLRTIKKLEIKFKISRKKKCYAIIELQTVFWVKKVKKKKKKYCENSTRALYPAFFPKF
jgi:hypothetical protein